MKMLKTSAAVALFVLFCAVPCMAGGPVYASGKAVEGSVKQTSVTLEDNHKYGKNFQAYDQIFPGNYKPAAGDTVVVVIEGTSNTDMSEIGFVIVDSTPAVNYWKLLCPKLEYKTVKAGTPFSYTLKFAVDQNSTAACADRGADFIVYSGEDQKVKPVLKITKFSYSITRK